MKKILILSLMVIMIFGISCVSATDNLTDDIGIADNTIEDISSVDKTKIDFENMDEMNDKLGYESSNLTNLRISENNFEGYLCSFENDNLESNANNRPSISIDSNTFYGSVKVYLKDSKGNQLTNIKITYNFDSGDEFNTLYSGNTIYMPNNLKNDEYHVITFAFIYDNAIIKQSVFFYKDYSKYSVVNMGINRTYFKIPSSEQIFDNMAIYLRDANKGMNIYENFTYYFDGAKENKHTFTGGVIDLNFDQNSYHTITMEYDGLKKVYTPTKYTFRFKFIKSLVIDEDHIEIVDGGIRIPAIIYDRNGKFNKRISKFAPFGTNNVSFYNEYTKYTLIKEFNVQKRILESNNLEIDYKDMIEYKVRAADKQNKFTSKLNITFLIDGKTYSVFTDNDGYATLKIHLKAGNYSITTKYWGVVNKNNITINPSYSDNYYESMYLDSATTYVGENKIINYGWNGYLKGSFKIYRDSKLIKTSDLDTSGYVNDYVSYNKYSNNISTAAYGAGYYTLKILDKNGNMLKESYMDIQKIPTQIQVNIIKTIANSKYTLKIKVKDKIGDKNVKNGYVNVKINGKTYNKVKVSGGVATLKITAPSKIKTYSCSVSFLENSIYKSSSTKFNMIVKKYTSKTTVKSISLTKGSSYTLKVNVKYSNGNKIKSGTVKVSINGKTYSAKINKGIAKVKIIAPSKVGKYNCKVTYAGNKLIYGSSNSFTITSQQKHVDITVNTKFNIPTKKTSGKYTVVTYKKMFYFDDDAGVYVAVYKDKNQLLPFNGAVQVWIHRSNYGWEYLDIIHDYMAEANGLYSVNEISSIDKVKVRIWI